jgi:hypothetical protein
VYAVITGDGVALEAAEVFTDLHAELHGVDTATAADALSAAGAGGLDGDHAWLDIAWLRAAGPDDDAWRGQFDGMIAYATSKGWVDEPGRRVRAHVTDPA